MPPEIDPQTLSILLLSCASGVFLVWALIRSSKSKQSLAQELTESHSASDNSVELVAELEGELQRVAVEVTERIDARVAELDEMMQRADELMVRLDRAMEQTRLADQQLPWESRGRMHDGIHSDGSKPRFREENLEERYAQVFWLLESGLNAEQIATRTGMQRGEVDLVLALRGEKELQAEA